MPFGIIFSGFWTYWDLCNKVFRILPLRKTFCNNVSRILDLLGSLRQTLQNVGPTNTLLRKCFQDNALGLHHASLSTIPGLQLLPRSSGNCARKAQCLTKKPRYPRLAVLLAALGGHPGGSHRRGLLEKQLE